MAEDHRVPRLLLRPRLLGGEQPGIGAHGAVAAEASKYTPGALGGQRVHRVTKRGTAQNGGGQPVATAEVRLIPVRQHDPLAFPNTGKNPAVVGDRCVEVFGKERRGRPVVVAGQNHELEATKCVYDLGVLGKGPRGGAWPMPPVLEHVPAQTQKVTSTRFCREEPQKGLLPRAVRAGDVEIRDADRAHERGLHRGIRQVVLIAPGQVHVDQRLTNQRERLKQQQAETAGATQRDEPCKSEDQPEHSQVHQMGLG